MWKVDAVDWKCTPECQRSWQQQTLLSRGRNKRPVNGIYQGGGIMTINGSISYQPVSISCMDFCEVYSAWPFSNSFRSQRPYLRLWTTVWIVCLACVRWISLSSTSVQSAWNSPSLSRFVRTTSLWSIWFLIIISVQLFIFVQYQHQHSLIVQLIMLTFCDYIVSPPPSPPTPYTCFP